MPGHDNHPLPGGRRSNLAAAIGGREPRRAHRDSQEPIIGGVAGGLARHLALPVLWVRVAFVVAAALGGVGIAMYAALWLVLPTDSHFEAGAPGLESATRGGRRPGRIRRLGDIGPAIALAALGLGAVFLLEAVLGRGLVFWPLFLGLVGIALLWRQADEAQRERWLDTTGRIDPVRAVLGRGGWAAYARLAAGIGLIVSAFVVFALRGGSLEMARDVTIAALLTVVGLGIVIGPWIYRLASDLTAERAERVRTQERADLAAHLHDSVLQTLALIQKNAGDGATVARLARSQERDLRSWLYAGEATDESTVASALRGVAAAVEDTHGVSVDVVNVGDCPLGGESATRRQRHSRGGDQRRQARRDRPDRRVRRGVTRGGRRVRPRPRTRLRRRAGRRGPARRPAQHHRPDGTARRHRHGAVDAG